MVDEEFPPGSELAGHRVVESLGTLGLAERFRVATPGGTERVAGVVEVIHPDMAPRLEALGIVGLRHENLVTVLQIRLAGTRPVLITDPIPGTLLRARLKEGPVSTELALGWFRGLVRGLQVAHERGLVHRDLRPDTIVVDGSTARILDLGVPTAMFDLVSGGRSVTTSGTTIGRPHYWAPERARRPQAADARADLFSLGCILYELLGGVGPFAGLNLYDCYHATLEEKFAPLTDRRTDLPPHVVALVTALLRAKPEDRPQSCAEVLEILDGVRTATAPSVSSLPAHRLTPPRQSAVGAVVGAVVAAILALALGWLLLRRA